MSYPMRSVGLLSAVTIFACVGLGTPSRAAASVVCSGDNTRCVVLPADSKYASQTIGSSGTLSDDRDAGPVGAPITAPRHGAAILPAANIADEDDEGAFDQPMPERPSFVPSLQFAQASQQTQQEVGFGLLDQLMERRAGVISQIDAMAEDVAELRHIPGINQSAEFEAQLQSLAANRATLAKLDAEIAALAGRQGAASTPAPATTEDADDPYDFDLNNTDFDDADSDFGGDDGPDDWSFSDDDDDDVDGLSGTRLPPVSLPTLALQKEEEANAEADTAQNPCVRGDEPGCVDLTGMGHPMD